VLARGDQRQTRNKTGYYDITFKDDQDQANVPQRKERLLPFERQDVADGHAVDEADNDVSDEGRADDLVGQPFCDGQKEKERDECQDANDAWFMIREERAASIGGGL
jgi:hypothetical protein